MKKVYRVEFGFIPSFEVEARDEREARDEAFYRIREHIDKDRIDVELVGDAEPRRVR